MASSGDSCGVKHQHQQQQQQQQQEEEQELPHVVAQPWDCCAYVVCGLLGGTSYSLLLWLLNQATGCFRSDQLLEIVTQMPQPRLLVLGALIILIALAAASYHYSSLSRAHCFLIAVGAAVCFSLLLHDPLHFLFSVAAALGISLFQETWATLGPPAVVNRSAKFVFFLGSAVIWGGNVWLVTHVCTSYLVFNFSALILCSLLSPATVALRSQGFFHCGVAHKDCSIGPLLERCSTNESLLPSRVCEVV